MDLIKKSTSPFIYHNEVNVEADKNNKNLSKDDVLFLYNQDTFVLSDLHIVKMIAQYSFLTQIQIFSAIQAYLNKYPNIPLVKDVDGLRNRLRYLTKSALIRRYHFQALDKNKNQLKKQSYYCVSPHGYNYIKRIVNFKEKYNEYIAATPIDEVFKFLSTGVVIQALINKSSSITFTMNKQVYVKEIKSIYDIYGEIKNKVNNIDYRVLIEPFKLRYDKNRMTEIEWKNNLNERIDFIKTYFSRYSADVSPYVIFSCEDLEGLKQAMKIIKDPLEDYLDSIYFTTDAILFFYGLDNALIKVVNDKGKSVLYCEDSIPFL